MADGMLRSPTFLVGAERQRKNLDEFKRREQQLAEAYHKNKPLCFNGVLERTEYIFVIVCVFVLLVSSFLDKLFVKHPTKAVDMFASFASFFKIRAVSGPFCFKSSYP